MSLKPGAIALAVAATTVLFTPSAGASRAELERARAFVQEVRPGAGISSALIVGPVNALIARWSVVAGLAMALLEYTGRD